MNPPISGIKTVFFDLDGTLNESGIGIINGIRYALSKRDIPCPSEETLRRFIGPPLVNSFMDYCGLSHEDALRAVTDYREYYIPQGMFEGGIYPGTGEMLKALSAAGLTLVVATAKPEPMSVSILAHYGLSRYFFRIAGATFDEQRITKKAVIDYALHECGISKAETVVMVGDRENDIEGGKAFGLHTVGVLYGYGSREELEAAGADRIAASPQELCRILLEMR